MNEGKHRGVCRSIPLDTISIQDSFWEHYVDLVSREMLPYQWEVINDRVPNVPPSGSIQNFKIAAGIESGAFYGMVFQDSDTYKWIEAAAYILAQKNDPELEKHVDETIAIIRRAQQPDGYLDTYYIINGLDCKWSNLTEGHELYCAGHLIEAAVAYYSTKGKHTLLDIAIRFANLICDTFGPELGKIPGYPGHQEIELAFMRLYDVTAEDRYLEMASFFLDQRGVGENWFLHEIQRPGFQRMFPDFSDYDSKYSQSHLPIREQVTAEGHAVRALYMYSAMADVAYAKHDVQLLQVCEKLWDNIVNKRMYITGSVGSSAFLERFTTDYDLPNDRNYSESCASVGLMLFGIRMARIFCDARYVDVVELALYNTVLAGVALDGKSFFYANPLEVIPEHCIEYTSLAHIKPVRQKWFGVACCPTNIARTLSSLGQYIYTYEKDCLYINLFISNRMVSDDGSIISIATAFPMDRTITIEIENTCKDKTVAIRIPSYVHSARFTVNGIEIDQVEIKKGFAMVGTKAHERTEITVIFDYKTEFMHASSLVSANVGKVALKRGPVVYCFEEVDNCKGLSRMFIDTNSAIEETVNEDIGIVQVRVKGKQMMVEENVGLYFSSKEPIIKDVMLTAIPYYYWANRTPGEMAVWMKELIKG